MSRQEIISKSVSSTFAGLALRPDLIGKRYISLLRCSTDHQADTSPDGQKLSNDAFASVQQMHWAGYDIYAEGVSGSQTFNREDIAEILELKRTRNDFDVVVVFELGRATRGGIRHGNVVENDLKKLGIELISSTEFIPEGPIGDLIKAVKHFANQQQAYNISMAVARGLAQSLAKSTRPAAGRTNFGLDRLYLDPQSQPRTLVRWEGAVQLRLDPITLSEISRSVRQPSRAPRTPGELNRRESRERFIGYRKQEDETSMFVAGSKHARDTVVAIWRMYYIEGLGAHRIIQWLRKQAIASPSGGTWNITSVHNILWNPIYLGIEVRHRWTKALYHKLGTDGPIKVDVDQDDLENHKRVAVPQTERPREEWVLVDKPRLKDFLPADVRQAAIPYITALYDEDDVAARQAKQAKRKNKSEDGPAILSQILHSQQTGHAMRGDSQKKKLKGGTVYRRYYFDYSTASKAISGLHARRVRAEPIENAVVPVIFESMMDRDWVESRVRAHVEKISGEVPDLAQQQARLTTEQEEIRRRLMRIHKTSGHLSDDDLVALVADDNQRLLAIRRALTNLDTSKDLRPPSAEESVQAVMQRIETLPSDWKSLPKAPLKQFLKAVIHDMSIDLATLEITFSLRVPNVAATPVVVEALGRKGRVSFASAWLLERDSTRDGGIEIAEINCVSTDRGRCFECRRLRRAA